MIEPIAIEKYSDAIKDKIIFDRFSIKETIIGSDIKQLTSVPQINSFVIKRLFDKWQEETEKLKSNYFDFDHKDVQQALKDFLAKLSFHIKVKKDHFEVLLKLALHDVFEYLENPVFFLQETFFHFNHPIVKCSEVKKKLKFLKLYAHEVSLLSEHEKLSSEEIYVEQLYIIIEDIFESADRKGQEETFVATLESIIPNNYVYIEPEPKESSKQKIVVAEPLVEEEPEEELPEEKFSQEIEEEIIEEVEEEITEDDSIEEKEEIVQEIETVKDAEEESEEVIPLYEKFEANDLIYKEDKKPETGNFSPIDKMTDGVSLHQKYFFIKELFNGDNTVYDYVIEKLDEYNSYDDASNFLLDNYAEKLDWHKKEESVSEFFSILNRRF